MPTKTKILFARHGQSVANAAGYLAGQLDVNLASMGEKQARATGRQLVELGQVPDVIISSPLLRARHTAELIAQEVGYTSEIVVLPELIERNFGALQGQSTGVLYDSDEEDILAAGGEPLDAFAERLGRVSKLLSDMDGSILIVGHSEAYRMATALARGLAPERYQSIDRPGNAQLQEYPLIQQASLV